LQGRWPSGQSGDGENKAYGTERNRKTPEKKQQKKRLDGAGPDEKNTGLNAFPDHGASE
jgi:hypothetical protein